VLSKIPRPIGSIALVATLLVLGVDVGVPANTAHADDCLTAPNSSAPQGRHWYYRLDLTNQRKCWYLRAPGPPEQQAAAQATSEAAATAQLHSMPAPSASMPATPSSSASVSVNPGDSAPPLPHVKMLAVKPARVMSATAAQAGSAAPLIPDATTPQTSASPKTSAQAVGPTPAASVAWPDATTAVATIKTQELGVVPTGARADFVRPEADARASDEAESIARGGKQTTSARMADSLTATPMEKFLILALGLAVAGTFSRVVMKIASARRARITVDRPGSDWVNDQSEHEWSNDQGHESFDERQEDHSLISAASDCIPGRALPADGKWPDNVRDEDGTFQITNEISKREARLTQLSQHLDRLLRWPRAA
jgi:hypothetical protein